MRAQTGGVLDLSLRAARRAGQPDKSGAQPRSWPPRERVGSQPEAPVRPDCGGAPAQSPDFLDLDAPAPEPHASRCRALLRTWTAHDLPSLPRNAPGAENASSRPRRSKSISMPCQSRSARRAASTRRQGLRDTILPAHCRPAGHGALRHCNTLLGKAPGSAAAGAAPCLVQGETWRGKGITWPATACQQRPQRAFIAINCAPFPRPCGESDCAHLPGTLTAARARPQGLIAAAHEARLFLETNRRQPLAPAGQAAAGACPNPRYQPAGCPCAPAVAVRFISASQPAAGRAGGAVEASREDFSYRLQRAELQLPCAAPSAATCKRLRRPECWPTLGGPSQLGRRSPRRAGRPRPGPGNLREAAATRCALNAASLLQPRWRRPHRARASARMPAKRCAGKRPGRQQPGEGAAQALEHCLPMQGKRLRGGAASSASAAPHPLCRIQQLQSARGRPDGVDH
ncbi:hypothetical protein FQR65_LT20923 [Abscondita terminalis]|nr:hypothetical protein FQR65_LT20923 [Abscondita terminalis]